MGSGNVDVARHRGRDAPWIRRLYYIDPVAAKRLVAVVVAASTIAMFFDLDLRMLYRVTSGASQGSPPVLSLA